MRNNTVTESPAGRDPPDAPCYGGRSHSSIVLLIETNLHIKRLQCSSSIKGAMDITLLLLSPPCTATLYVTLRSMLNISTNERGCDISNVNILSIEYNNRTTRYDYQMSQFEVQVFVNHIFLADCVAYGAITHR